jgi:replicative DNA helicase
MTDSKLAQSSHRVKSDSVKLPPHSIEAEQSVLGGLMLDNDAWDKVSSKLLEQDFYRHQHRLIYQVMHTLIKKDQPVDVLTVSEALKDIEQLDNAGGELYLYELANNTPGVANIEAYAGIVRERSVLRQLISVATDIADSAFKPEGRAVEELLDAAETKVFAIAEQSLTDGGPKSISRILQGEPSIRIFVPFLRLLVVYVVMGGSLWKKGAL